VGPYQVVRRVAPSCFDAETIASGAPVRVELASDADAALIDIRFTRAQAQLSLVDHPLVAQIIDHGMLSNGRPWVASERPAGTALSDVLTQRRLEPREVTALIYSVAQVLAFAHHRQVVHGSLRPHHLTLSRGAKVSLSGWAWLRTPGIPAFGDPANTSVYNPPEHDGQSPIDGRADVYALGAIAYRALTGVFPDVSRDLLDGNDPLGAAIENMLSLDARDRNSAAAIVADLHIQRQADRAASKARASSESEAPAPRASSPSIAPQTLPRGSSAALDPNDLAERLARAEQEIEELRARASSEAPRTLADAPRGSSENVRVNIPRGSSENLRPSGSRTIEIVSVLGPDPVLLTPAAPAPVMLTPAPIMLTPAPIRLTPAPVLLTPAPELEARPTNRMPSQADIVDDRLTDRMTSAAENEATATDVLSATDVDALDNHV
jgi:serine/threonine protein kinase